LSDEEWAIRLVEAVTACAKSGDGVKRFSVLEKARLEADGSAVRRMTLTTLEAFMPKLDGELTARKYAESMIERFGAAKTIFNGPVTQGAGSTAGVNSAIDTTISETGRVERN